MATDKTNAARLLDKAAVTYELISYEVDETDLSAVHVASQLNEPVERVFKTLVLKGDKTEYFVAKLSGNKNCEMLLMKDLLPITGYIRGACSPIAMKKHFPTYIHDSCRNFDKIYVSAGKRGLQLYLTPQDLINEIKATVGYLIV